MYLILFLLCIFGCHKKSESAIPPNKPENVKNQEESIEIGLFPAPKQKEQVEQDKKIPVVKRTLNNLDVPLRFYLVNNSQTDYHYYGMGRYGPTHDSIQACPIRLHKGGVLIPHKMEIEGAGIRPKYKRILKPGQRILYEVRLDSYELDQKPGNLKGRYKLRVEFLITPECALAEYGYTPIELNKTIMIIDLAEEK